MKTFLFISMVFFSSFVHAQKVKKPVPLEVKTFRLSKFPIADFPKRSIPVSDIQVIQVLRDSVRLGYTMKGIDNYIVMLTSEKPPTYFLQQGIYRMYLNDFKEGGAQVLWVIKDLRLGEKSAFMEYAYTRFNADAYISKDAVLFKKVCSIDTVFVTESGGDLTAWHGEDIENAFRVLLKRTLQQGKEVIEQNIPGQTIENIMELSKPQIDFPILNDEVYREGAYASFDEFLANKPSIADFRVFVMGKKKEVKFVKTSENNLADTIKVWGFCKGGEIFKYDQDLLIPIEKQGKGFIISNYVEQATRRNSAMAGMAFLAAMGGGIIGGVIVGSIASSNAASKTLLVKSIPYITKSKKQPEATCIDMRTGELTF